MKSKIGILCMILGVLLMAGAFGFHYMNRQEDIEAQMAVREVVPQLVERISENAEPEAECESELLPQLQVPVELLTEEDKAMTEAEIDGYMYIGYISIPEQELELPVMSTWSYPQLKIAPCRYSGSVRGEDMVLMAHNYVSHFGKLSNLELGSKVWFTDMDGTVTAYEVVGKDLLPPTAVDEMTAGDFDLTLFTCTYSGTNRITVYCDMVE